MIVDYSFEENIKDFNRMFNELNPFDYDGKIHTMIGVIVEKIEVEQKLENIFYNNTPRFQDVLTWANSEKLQDLQKLEEVQELEELQELQELQDLEELQELQN